MPPKRTASRFPKVNTPTRIKLEDGVAGSGSDDEVSGSALRRSPRKRQRVEPAKTKLEDEESSLTSVDSADEYEEKPIVKTEPMDLAKFAYSSRPTRGSAKTRTPAKQLKLEETGAFPADEESKPKTGARKTKTSTTPSKKSANASPRKQKAIVMELEKPHPAPPHWEEQYALIEEMRAGIQAPVDTMGCAKSMTGVGPLKDQRFGTLVSLMLSSQTKDEVTAAAVNNLREVLPGGLTVNSLLAAEPSVISEAIGKVGFWRRKTEYLRQAAAIIRDKFDGDVPKTIDELCSLPGVGPKMAFLVLQVAWDINAGIGVDVHVHRISNRLGWHKPETTTPEQTRLNMQSWLPRNLHKPINPLLVGFGQASSLRLNHSIDLTIGTQVICLPVGPRCDVCLLSSKGLCPSARVGATGKGKKPIVFTPKAKIAQAEVGDAPDLDAEDLVRLDVKKEDADHDIGQPRIQIKLEE